MREVCKEVCKNPYHSGPLVEAIFAFGNPPTCGLWLGGAYMTVVLLRNSN